MKNIFRRKKKSPLPLRNYLVQIEVSVYKQRIQQKIHVTATNRLSAKLKALKRSKFATSTDIKSIKRLKDQ